MTEAFILLTIMQKAADAFLAIQSEGLSIERKANNDIVTQADLKINDLIRTSLTEYFPGDHFLSEESRDDRSRLGARRVWIIDPIDGTRELAANIPEFAISVALIEEGILKLSSIMNPVTHELFFAVKGKGAWLNHNKISCLTHHSQKLNILASRSEYERGEWKIFAKQHYIKPVGSIAYKLALLAAGHAHATFSLGEKNEWDVAAGALLVMEAGGNVTNHDGEVIIFNRCSPRLNGIIAATHDCYEQVFSLIKNYQQEKKEHDFK